MHGQPNIKCALLVFTGGLFATCFATKKKNVVNFTGEGG